MSPAFVSFAQNFEDVMLWRALKHVDRGFYIDVGAYSPVEHSVTQAFYERGWRGINIEPHPEYYRAFVVARPQDINLRVAVGDRTTDMTMYLVHETGLSTLDEGQGQEREREGRTVVAEPVHVETISSIWTAHVPADQPVHFLKVDVEGFEHQVLLGNDWSVRRPWIVVVEATLPMTTTPSFAAWEDLLTGTRYVFVYADGLNRFYVAEEHAELATAFQFPPNIFDEFVRASELEAADRAWRGEVALRTIYASRSWRWSRPIRIAGSRARRMQAVVGRVLGNDRRRLREPAVRTSLRLFQSLRRSATLRRAAAFAKSVPAVTRIGDRLERASRRRGWQPWYRKSDLSPRAQKIYEDLKNSAASRDVDHD